MDDCHLDRLPEELLELIVFHLPPSACLAYGSTCKRANKIAFEHIVWRRHCVQEWRYWEPRHELEEKLERPPAQIKWRQLFNERHRMDKDALEIFEDMLKTQQNRIMRIEKVTQHGYNVKDMLQKLRDRTPDDAEDVLARRYYADVMLGQIHRMTALEKWGRLARRQMVKLEDVMGAYDLFVLGGRKGDLKDIDNEFQRIANVIRAGHENFDNLSIRQKAIQVAIYLRLHELVGNPIADDYHALRNNFISIALFDPVHTSLPLQSVTIYCAVARKLGVNARPSNYPHHVHAVITAPSDETLDGVRRIPDPNTDGFDPEIMHMDPWRSSSEVPREDLNLRLTQMGAPLGQHAAYLGPASTMEIALRTGRNIMNSVQEYRSRSRTVSRQPQFPDSEAAWYSMLWSMMILGDQGSGNTAATLHRRRQCLPYLAEVFQNHFPEDLGLLERLVTPFFEGENEQHVLIELVESRRAADRNAEPPSPRTPGRATDAIKFRIGQYFQHKRYGYEAIVVGWDATCTAEDSWIRQMRVDDLIRGRHQPFYNVIADDKSVRYVAEENIHPVSVQPCESLMVQAGKYFKRWDVETSMFISNIRDEYPDD